MTGDLVDTIPCRWLCHVCHDDFQPPLEGGICGICLQPTCFYHLQWTYVKDADTDVRRRRLVCPVCRKHKAAEGHTPPSAGGDDQGSRA